MKHVLIAAAAALFTVAVQAKLPVAPMDDAAKAKAAEAAAKTAHGNKVAAFRLCKSMDRTAAHYYKNAKCTGKDTKPPVDTPACADPGAFVWPVPAAGAAPAATTAKAAAAPAKPGAAPAKPAAAPAKKT